MMLMDTEFTLFLTHVGNLTTVKSNQRRFAPTPAHITGITCPHHRNTQLCRPTVRGYLFETSLARLG
jgi:hypothetical protein